MNIVLEGPDGSGKSTLARVILQHVPALAYTPGEGPPKYPGEMPERVERYLRLNNCLFDRHPCVSQLIYDRFRTNGEGVPQHLVDRFYASKPFFIYCYGRGPHIADNSHADTLEHLAMIEEHDNSIRDAYHEWGSTHVPVFCWYSIEDPHLGTTTEAIIDSIKKELSHAK